MSSQSHTQIKITRRAATLAGLTLSRNANQFTILHSGRNMDLDGVSFGLSGALINPLQRNGPHGAAHGLIKGNEDVTFDVAATYRTTPLIELSRVKSAFTR